mmetsp:Transcript_3770/g.11009  ORF Transcript_3770/g.11009 Transcript_3770/m.11009 type:complete len:750 (+) Transcript_3770:55-2304(+)
MGHNLRPPVVVAASACFLRAPSLGKPRHCRRVICLAIALAVAVPAWRYHAVAIAGHPLAGMPAAVGLRGAYRDCATEVSLLGFRMGARTRAARRGGIAALAAGRRDGHQQQQQQAVPVLEGRQLASAEPGISRGARASGVEDWPQKSSRAEFRDTHWGEAQPLPHMLWGNVSRVLRGVVEDVSAAGVLVRLVWEVSAPKAARTQLRPSPIAGFLDGQALSSAFPELLLPPEPGKVRRFLREGQHVSVRVRPRPLDGEDAQRMLALELAREQPIEPAKEEAFAQPRPLSVLADFLQAHRLQASGLQGVGAAPAGLESEHLAPPSGWDDRDWEPWLNEVPREPQDLPPLVAAGWALADPGRDIAVAGPLSPGERALLYLLPLLRHLRGRPAPMSGGGPLVLILGAQSIHKAVRESLDPFNISVGELSKNPKQWDKLKHCLVVLAHPKAFRKDPPIRLSRILSHISLVVFDDLGFWVQARESDVRGILQGLPAHRWGPTVAWLHRWNASLAPALGAFTDAPVTLRAADSIWGARVHYEAVNASEAAAVATRYMHRHPRLSILFFADDAAASRQALSRVDTQRRLGPSTAENAAGRGARVEVVSNREPWQPEPPSRTFELTVHVDPPPSSEELHRRLASCRGLAVLLPVLDPTGGGLAEPWRAFAKARLERAGSEERRLLLDLLAGGRTRAARAPPPEEVAAGHAAPADAIGLAGEAGDRFEDDFRRGEGGELVWEAGEEPVDEEFAAFGDAM